MAGGAYHLPPGYIETDRGAADIRTVLSRGPEVIPPGSWVTDNRLKLGASEILSRGRQGERVRARLASKEYTKTKAEDEYKRLGVRGLPLFAGLSYFKCVPESTGGRRCTAPCELWSRRSGWRDEPLSVVQPATPPRQ